MIKQIGLQLWSVRDLLATADDIRNTMTALKEMGYDFVQTCSWNIPVEEFSSIIHNAGLTVCGTHVGFDKMVEEPETVMEEHRILKTTNIGIGGTRFETKEDVEEFIEKANKFAEIIYPHGFKFTYHNHSHEFVKFDGDKTIMDMLVEGLDPEKTSFCLDTYWIQNAGGDVCSWIEKLAGRIDILHLKDMGVGSDEKNYITEVGNGNMNFAKIIEAAEKIGVKYFVVEQDTWPGNPLDSVKFSSEYIHKNFMK